MRKKWIVGAALVASLALPAVPSAHEGHTHKVMGTVHAIHEKHLEVKDTKGNTVTVTLTDKTKIRRGTIKATTVDIKEGDRVVVTYQTQPKTKTNLATVVQLATGKSAKASS